MKKFEFVYEKELTTDGIRERWFTTEDGQYVSNSLSLNKERGEKFFNEFVKVNGQTKTTEILQTLEL